MNGQPPEPARLPGEPTLAEVQAQHPTWQCAQGISGIYHAQHTTTGRHVTGEDPLDLNDQIKTAEARHHGPLIP